MFPSPFQDPEAWDALSDAEKRAELNSFMVSKGFDPVEYAKENRIRRLEEEVQRLKTTVEVLESKIDRIYDEQEQVLRDIRNRNQGGFY